MLNMNITFLALLILTTFSCVYLHFGANASRGASKGGRDLLWESQKKALFASKNANLNGCYTFKGHGSISVPGPRAPEQEGEVHNSLPGPECIIYPLQFSINWLLKVPSL